MYLSERPWTSFVRISYYSLWSVKTPSSKLNGKIWWWQRSTPLKSSPPLKQRLLSTERPSKVVFLGCSSLKIIRIGMYHLHPFKSAVFQNWLFPWILKHLWSFRRSKRLQVDNLHRCTSSFRPKSSDISNMFPTNDNTFESNMAHGLFLASWTARLILTSLRGLPHFFLLLYRSKEVDRLCESAHLYLWIFFWCFPYSFVSLAGRWSLPSSCRVTRVIGELHDICERVHRFEATNDKNIEILWLI